MIDSRMFYIIAITSGLILGYFVSRRTVNLVLLVAYHFRYRKEDKYLELYDLMDTEFNFDMAKATMPSLKSYADYLKLRQAARPTAYDMFTKQNKDTASFLFKYFLLLVLLPTIIFFKYWYVFLLTEVFVMILFILHRHFIKGYRLDFYAILAQSTILKDYQDQHSR